MPFVAKQGMNLPTVLYICSAARCGSTITDMFLGGHSRVASLGEINFLGKAVKLGEACSCGEPVASCPAWKRLYDAVLQKTGINIPEAPYAYRLWDARSRVIIDREYQNALFHAKFLFRRAWLGLRESLPAGLRTLTPIPPAYEKALHNKMQLFQLLADSWGKSVIVDSSKNPWEAIELAARWPAQVKVVLVTRDGRGVYFSRRSSGFDPKVSVREWMKYYRRAAPMLVKHLPAASLMQMRYEDFASDPEGRGRELCAFAGIEYEASMLDLSRGERHMANGNNTRFSPGKGIRLDERWRDGLKDEELAYFERHGGAVNRKLGYR